MKRSQISQSMNQSIHPSIHQYDCFVFENSGGEGRGKKTKIVLRCQSTQVERDQRNKRRITVVREVHANKKSLMLFLVRALKNTRSRSRNVIAKRDNERTARIIFFFVSVKWVPPVLSRHYDFRQSCLSSVLSACLSFVRKSDFYAFFSSVDWEENPQKKHFPLGWYQLTTYHCFDCHHFVLHYKSYTLTYSIEKKERER